MASTSSERFTPPRLPTDLVTINEMARKLGLRHDRAELLALADLAQAVLGRPTTFRDHNDRLMVTRDALAFYQSVPYMGPHPDAFLTRVVPATEVADPTRTHKGFHGAMTKQELTLALNRWWEMADPEWWVGKDFVASIAGFVVHGGRITDYEVVDGQVIVELDTEHPDYIATWRGRRFDSPRGRKVVHVSPNQFNTN